MIAGAEGLAGAAGQRGDDVRSDCWIAVDPRASGGLAIELESLVESYYGDAIRASIADGARALGLEHARVVVEDRGALPFVLMARFEAAVRRARPATAQRWLPETGAFAASATTRDRLRRSRLYLPGNEPKYAINAGLHGPDGVILDLEDSVAPTAKDAARILVRNALRAVDFGAAERMVRINPGAGGLQDVAELADTGVQLVLIPKVERPEEVQAVDTALRAACGHDVLLMPILETARGVLNALAIAESCPRVVALTIGLEDYTADLGTQRTDAGRESLWARSMVVNAARAAGLQAIDSVYSDVGNEDGLRASIEEAKALGFEGQGCIHPRQIRVVHAAFAPTPAEVQRACRIVRAFEDAQARGLGVVSLGTKMIDPPVVKRAEKTVAQALVMRVLAADWRAREEA